MLRSYVIGNAERRFFFLAFIEHRSFSKQDIRWGGGDQPPHNPDLAIPHSTQFSNPYYKKFTILRTQ